MSIINQAVSHRPVGQSLVCESWMCQWPRGVLERVMDVSVTVWCVRVSHGCVGDRVVCWSESWMCQWPCGVLEWVMDVSVTVWCVGVSHGCVSDRVVCWSESWMCQWPCGVLQSVGAGWVPGTRLSTCTPTPSMATRTTTTRRTVTGCCLPAMTTTGCDSASSPSRSRTRQTAGEWV